MPHSSTNSSEEDVELPDAPQSPAVESEGDENSLSPKPEPHSDPADPVSVPRMKEEEEDDEKDEKEEDGEEDENSKSKLEGIFTDDEDLLDDDDADMLAPEIGVVYE